MSLFPERRSRSELNRRIETLEDILTYWHLHHKTRWFEALLTTEQKDLLADIHDARREPEDSPFDRWWRKNESSTGLIVDPPEGLFAEEPKRYVTVFGSGAICNACDWIYTPGCGHMARRNIWTAALKHEESHRD